MREQVVLGSRNQAPEFHIEGHNRVYSARLKREVVIDLFLPSSYPFSTKSYPFLILNDGQDSEAVKLKRTLSKLTGAGQIREILVFAVHAGDRMQEYGVASQPDFKKRGAKAKLYSRFVVDELLPILSSKFRLDLESGINSIAGFSLGGLSAFDIGWNHPDCFQRIGVFSGSLWWRSIPYGEGFDEFKSRIIHNVVRSTAYKPGLRFWFETGTKDESADRNQNGVIDSIDDTLDLIVELTKKGYRPFHDIEYLEIKDGTHNQRTWAKALPEFLRWTFGN